MPITRKPQLIASIVAEAMTPLIPGAGPPPTKIARVSLMLAKLRALLLRSFFRAEVADPLEDPLRNCRELACIAVGKVELVVRRALVIRKREVPRTGARCRGKHVVGVRHAARRCVAYDEWRCSDQAAYAECNRFI